jgi:hypothetical protein
MTQASLIFSINLELISCFHQINILSEVIEARVFHQTDILTPSSATDKILFISGLFLASNNSKTLSK